MTLNCVQCCMLAHCIGLASHATVAVCCCHLPCVVCRSEAEVWLNDPEVRAALHAAPQSVTGPWQLCSDRIFYTSNGGSMLPVHNFLVRESGEYEPAVQRGRQCAWHGR
jgi:hypothetical protein